MPAGRALGLGFQIGDHADDVFGDQSANRTAGIDSVQDLAVRSQQEPRRLKVARRLVVYAPVTAATLSASALWPSGKLSLNFSIVPTVVASSSTDSATTLMPVSASFSLAR